MIEDDFAFFADPVTLERALGLSELLEAFIQEARIRFIGKVVAAMAAMQATRQASWSLDKDEEKGEAWLVPRAESPVPAGVWPIVGPGVETGRRVKPYWGIYSSNVSAKNLTLAETTVASLLRQNPTKGGNYYFEYVPDVPGDIKGCLLAIIGDEGDRLAARMAAKAAEIAAALETAFKE